jgi:hypothetical protein
MIRSATDDATDDATLEATDDATNHKDKWFFVNGNMTKLANDLGVGLKGLECARDAYKFWQGGNQWSGWDSFLSFFRHVVKLDIDYSKYDAWETLSLHSGPRAVHAEFCIISDRPDVLLVDDQNRPHCDTGPFCRWRDGSALYSIHGVRVPKWIIHHPEKITAKHVIEEENAEVKRVMYERMGTERFASEAQMTVIHEDTMESNFPVIPETEEMEPGKRMVISYRKGTEVARLLRCDAIKDFDDRPLKFAQVTCPSTGRVYHIRVKHDAKRAYEAIASTFGMSEDEYKKGRYVRQGDVAIIPLDGDAGFEQSHS